MATPEERLWERVPQPAEGCWNWPGATIHGYGVIAVNRKNVDTHRLSYQSTHGPIPKGMSICHHCDNPRCVRPNHLFVGTNRDNMRDMYAKGRNRNGAMYRTHCPKGHPYEGENLAMVEYHGRPWRRCLTCSRNAARIHQAEYRRINRDAINARRKERYRARVEAAR